MTTAAEEEEDPLTDANAKDLGYASMITIACSEHAFHVSTDVNSQPPLVLLCDRCYS